MKNLKKTVAYVKDNKKSLIAMGGLTIAGMLMEVVLVNKVIDNLKSK